jgi:hypothetical protein
MHRSWVSTTSKNDFSWCPQHPLELAPAAVFFHCGGVKYTLRSELEVPRFIPVIANCVEVDWNMAWLCVITKVGVIAAVTAATCTGKP